MSYAIGQVLYVVMSNENKIVPVMIVEEITKKTLTEGTTMTYRVQLGSDPKQTALITDLKGEIFESLGSVREMLLKKITAFIDGIVAKAKSNVVEWYGQEPAIEQMMVAQQANVQHQDVPVAFANVTLPDGTVARVTLPADSLVE